MNISDLMYFVVKSLIIFLLLMSKIIKKVLFLHRPMKKMLLDEVTVDYLYYYNV